MTVDTRKTAALIALVWAGWVVPVGAMERPADPDVRALIEQRCPGTAVAAGCIVGDFDGDRKPDVVYAVGHRSGFRFASIAVHLSSSSRGEQALNLPVWPAATGFLSRDVDGDHDMDVVVTAGFRKVVAVLLNDGSGGFALAAGPRFAGSATGDDGPELLGQPSGMSEAVAEGSSPAPDGGPAAARVWFYGDAARWRAVPIAGAGARPSFSRIYPIRAP